MYGRKTDVLGGTLQQAALADQPANRFVTQNNFLGIAGVKCGDNRQAILASRRTVPFMCLTRPQPPSVSVINQRESVFGYGGQALIPEAGIWKTVK